MTAVSRPLVIGCGVLRGELQALARARGAELELRLLGPAMHVDLSLLERALVTQLEKVAPEPAKVFFGACHPRLDTHLTAHGARRTRGTNCLEMLLGPERYEAELARGAYFLLEPWARQWAPTLRRTFGDRPELIRDVFRGAHSCVLAIRTPCSGDFTAQAEAAAALVGLPLEWADATLDHLGGVLDELLQGAP